MPAVGNLAPGTLVPGATEGVGVPGRRVAYGPVNAARYLVGLGVHVDRVVVAVAEA